MPKPLTYPLTGGLDLLSAPLTVHPGSLVDCCNYEVAVHDGYRRIDGYRRFDGWRQSLSATSYIKVTSKGLGVDLGPDEVAGTCVVLVGYVGVGIVAGKVIVSGEQCLVGLVHAVESRSVPGGTFDIDVYCTVSPHYDTQGLSAELWTTLKGYVLFKSEQNAITWIKGYAGVDYYSPGGTHVKNRLKIDPKPGGMLAVRSLNESGIVDSLPALNVAAEHEASAAVYRAVRSGIQPVFGQGAVHGLLWFRDYLYAIRDMRTIPFVAGNKAPSVGDIIGHEPLAGEAAGPFRGIVAAVYADAGSWDGGDASGVIVLRTYSGGTLGPSVPVDNVTTSDAGIFNTAEAMDVSGRAAAIYKAVGTDVSGMRGWEYQHLGYTARFKSGVAPFKSRSIADDGVIDDKDILTTLWRVPTATGGYDGWTSYTSGTIAGTPSRDFYVDMVDDGDTHDGDGTYVQSYSRVDGSGNMADSHIEFSSFGFDEGSVPPGSMITGVELEVVRRARPYNTSTGEIVDNDIHMIAERSAGSSSAGANVASNAPWASSAAALDNSAYEAVMYGGKRDVMGLPGLAPEDVRKPTFGVSLSAKDQDVTGPFGASVEARITSVRVRVHYAPPGDAVYFWDGSAVHGTAHVINSHKTDGAYDQGDAEGIIYISDTSSVVTAAGGMEIRTMPPDGVTPDGGIADGSTLLAKLDGRPTPTTLEPSSAMQGGRYETVENNFYARRDLGAVYGVNGAGPAFMFDGTYFARIHTGLPQQDDKPTHVAAHQGHLFLGYSMGTGVASSTGMPMVFDALSGAFEVGFGSPVTGMYSLNGDALAVFTATNVQMLQGAIGSGAYQSVISPAIGAIEWSAQSMGQFLFLSITGIQSIESVESYGDYRPSPLSAAVWPWLRPRVQTPASVASGSSSLIGSIAVRNKAQYRLMFSDGYQLTATFLRDGEAPQYTIQRYVSPAGDPIAWAVSCYGVDSTGRDRMFASALDGAGYVYELDVGVNFDDAPISAYVTMSVNDSDAPWQWKRYTDAAIFGQMSGAAAFTLERSGDYAPIKDGNAIACRFGDPDVVRAPPGAHPDVSFVPVQIEGKSISLRLSSASRVTPPHAFQSISLETSALGKKRG